MEIFKCFSRLLSKRKILYISLLFFANIISILSKNNTIIITVNEIGEQKIYNSFNNKKPIVLINENEVQLSSDK